MPSPENVIGSLTDALSRNPNVVALVLAGSYARTDIYTATPHSDIELYIVVRDGKTEEVNDALPGLVSGIGRVLFSYRHAIGFVAVFDDLLRLELPVIGERGMSRTFSRPKDQTLNVLADHTGGKLSAVLEKRPDTIDIAREFRKSVPDFWYWQTVGVQYYVKGEYYAARSVLNIHASALIRLFELRNNPDLLLLETNKRIERFLTAGQLAAVKRVTPAYDPAGIRTAFLAVMDAVPAIQADIGLVYGYGYDAELARVMKPKLRKLLGG